MRSRWKSYSKRLSCSCKTGGKESKVTPFRASCTSSLTSQAHLPCPNCHTSNIPQALLLLCGRLPASQQQLLMIDDSIFESVWGLTLTHQIKVHPHTSKPCGHTIAIGLAQEVANSRDQLILSCRSWQSAAMFRKGHDLEKLATLEGGRGSNTSKELSAEGFDRLVKALLSFQRCQTFRLPALPWQLASSN